MITPRSSFLSVLKPEINKVSADQRSDSFSTVQEGPTDAVIIMLCDQPYVTKGLLDLLIAVHEDTGNQIVVCEYSSTFGVPALFGPALFGPLASLSEDQSTRWVIRECDGPVARRAFLEESLDTAQDAAMLLDVG